MRWRVASFALVAWAAGGAIEAPAQAPYQTTQRPLVTIDPSLAGPGWAVIETGAGFAHDREIPASGLTGDVLRVPELTLRAGLGSRVELRVDGDVTGTDTTAPYSFGTDSSLGVGAHEVSVRAVDAAGNDSIETINVTLDPDADPTEPSQAGGGDGSQLVGGCSASQRDSGMLAMLLCAASLIVISSRRRRRACAP